MSTFEESYVTVTQGQICGMRCTNKNNGEYYYSYTGIPYGKPPIGPLRFKAPQPAEPWEGVRDCLKVGNACRARDMVFKTEFVGSEDCLYLNVFTPKSADKGRRAVMVFIHGGGFQFGSSDPELYSPDFLLKENIVLVTINYRLGVLGFLAFTNPEIGIPGNAGLKDQVLALHWVKDNIAQFGGDPNNVTIFGESAGAASVHYHILSPLSKGLFHRAICQSGTANADWACDSRRPHNLAKYLGCLSDQDEDICEFLSQVPVQDLVEHQDAVITEEDLRDGLTVAWGPTVEVPCESDPPFIAAHPSDVLRSGNFNHVPTIFGYNKDEGLLFLSPAGPQGLFLNPTFTDNEVLVPRGLRLERGKSVSKSTGDTLFNFYYRDTTPSMENLQPFIDVMTDIVFAAPMYLAVKYHAKVAQAPTYFYRFCADTKLNIFKTFFQVCHPGACHGDELAYLFTNLFTSAQLREGSYEAITVHRMVKLWTTFAKTGNPNLHNNDPLIDVEWKPVIFTEINYLNIDKTLMADTNPDEKRMNLWECLVMTFKSYNVPK